MKIEAGAHGIFFSANLTPDNETGLGTWTEAQIAAAIQTGHTPDRRLSYWAMPWQVYGGLSASDALAIGAYLKSIPAVRNRIPEPLYFGSLETVARKLTYPWPAVPPQRLVFAAGNFGNDDASADGHSSTQIWLLRGQRLLLLIAAIAWVSGRRGARSEQRHGGASMTAALLLFVGAAAVAFVERYPALGPMPPGPVVGAFVESIPAVTADDRSRALRERGRYLFATSSCAFCHRGDGGGGNKVSWRTIGAVWSANLTPHANGLATWSDDDIVRALRSGVRRDGRQIHWQAMPWDSFSNFREEDLRSLVAYVRGLTPLSDSKGEVSPPGSDDCPDFTFWVRDSGDESGCN
jgi:mono/diheme cytochrome c family protein